ncbi:plasminogen-like [Ruditapes philippinarum]|uniref:plasminogen-like n=1 Tax=Ruditapes philippinarum TaxID=129788 RepID=UPI00295A81D1|nr:plasminogen-like [Ruditapes philippinarum]
MDTATVTCDAWYQTRNNTITGQISGEWETTICEDCYLTTPWEYTGKRNTTVTGMPCHRWDSPEAMIHGYTDLQYFPESTLSEAENFCRNPDSWDYEPWCITTNENAPNYWEYCDIKKC